MRFRTFLTYLSLLPLSACTRSCNDYDNNEEFAQAKLPPYTETGANTLGCVLGPQVWTVLGKHRAYSIGGGWESNQLIVEGGYSIPRTLQVHGGMTGVRNSKEFYDRRLYLVFLPSDTLGGLRLLGGSNTNERVRVTDFITGLDYTSISRRPVRLLVRKLNRQQRIVSGTFEGMLYSDNTGQHDSLAVADGRFDVRY
ncbi:hypothetical protein [Hymenobacter glaciei]